MDLRRRDKEDRERERAEATADSIAERQEERKAREAEREQDRKAREVERTEERDHQYKEVMRRQWLELEDQITRVHWGSPPERVELFPRLSATLTLTGALARGEDRQVFDVLHDRFTIAELEGEVGMEVSVIITLYARNEMPSKFAIKQLEDMADQRDAAMANRES